MTFEFILSKPVYRAWQIENKIAAAIECTESYPTLLYRSDHSAGSSAVEFAFGNRSSSALIGSKIFGHGISSCSLIVSG